MKPDEKYFTELNYMAPNSDGEFRCDFCDCIMIPIVYTSFYTADNALIVAPESPPSCRGQQSYRS
jgi:hypothetical protein